MGKEFSITPRAVPQVATKHRRIKNRAGQVTELFLADTTPMNLACGVQRAPRSVSLSYAAQPDEDRRTAGNITEIAWR